MPFQSRFILSDPGNLHLMHSAPAPKDSPLFFLHGNSLCAAAYRPLLSGLHSRGFSVLAADIRGHGRSTREGALPLYNWDPFILDIARILKTARTGPVTGVGHSMGAFFLYAAAARFPGLFSRLILLDPVIFPMRHILFFSAMRMLDIQGSFSLPRRTRNKRKHFPDKESVQAHYQGKGMFRHWHPESFQGFLDQGLRPLSCGGLELACDPELEARFYESVPTDTWSHAPRIACPVHIFRAENSHLFAPDAARRLQREIPLADVGIVEKRGHFFPLEIPEICADLVVQCHKAPCHRASHEKKFRL